MFAEIRLREIRCEVEVGRGSCALFAKAKVDARERLEFTEGSTPRERCLSVTTADTRECLEILVFLFLVTLSLSLSSPLCRLLFLLSLYSGPKGTSLPLLYILRRYTNFRGTSSSRKKGGRSTSRRESDPFREQTSEGSFFESCWKFVRLVRGGVDRIEGKLFSTPRLGFRNILILGEAIRAQRREWKRRGKGEQKWVNTVAVTFKGRKEFVEGGKAYVSLLFPLPHRQIALSPRKLASCGGLFFPK